MTHVEVAQLNKDAERTRARSFEQDLLWSVLDQDAVPHIITMARDNWSIEPLTAWHELGKQNSQGCLPGFTVARRPASLLTPHRFH